MNEDERTNFVSTQWANYKKTKDLRHLANIAKEMPFFGHPEVGEEIARLLSPSDNLQWITEHNFAAYKRTGDKKWLENMLRLEAFRNEPMGNEISSAFAQSLVCNRDRTQERDDFIVSYYAAMHFEITGEQFSVQLNKEAIKWLYQLFEGEVKTEETLRSILRNKKHKILEHVARNQL